MKQVLILLATSMVCMASWAQPRYNYEKLNAERLDRGVVAIKTDRHQVCVSWRTLRSDKKGEAFDVYRNGVKLNASALTKGGTFFVDEHPIVGADAVYEVKGGGNNSSSSNNN